jgi:CBS domain-containing protein
MALPSVRDVMTERVIAVREAARYKDIVQVLIRFGVSAVPVVDDQRRVLGVVSEADLIAKVEFAQTMPHYPLMRRRRRFAQTKAAGDLAGEFMTAPAVTIGPDASIVEAARLMDTETVKRLPVVDDTGRLVGLVARRDLLRAYLRPDDAIRVDVCAELASRVPGIGPDTLDVTVNGGVVTLSGTAGELSTALVVTSLVRAVPGVVDVIDRLVYRHDDATVT